ncbi:type IV toxin-antitoxin system AbiEi family antitoxin domain-containing protein [Gemmatimonas sp.]|uniref:type IV toxin-antitoxin system AbiEi family antitoxin domain-containing protein n=1 Tax=Gemmatimonas sp. TaxID=1962908 RepID=UPI0031F2E61A
MATVPPTKLKSLYERLRPGQPITSSELAELGISKYLAVHYARAGWLTRIARGVYSQPWEALHLNPSLRSLEASFEGFHVGGKTALDWHGVRHYVSQQPVLHLYGLHAARLPLWFTSRFPAEYHRKRLFNEVGEELLYVGRWSGDAANPLVSDPERGWLELLSEVGVRQPLEEVRELAESVHALRVRVLRDLLTRCTSVKTVRLCLQLGREMRAPWAAKLDASTLPTGSKSPWVARTRDGLLVLPP